MIHKSTVVNKKQITLKKHGSIRVEWGKEYDLKCVNRVNWFHWTPLKSVNI